jgi:hypothetical protein
VQASTVFSSLGHKKSFMMRIEINIARTLLARTILSRAREKEHTKIADVLDRYPNYRHGEDAQ